MRCPFSKPFAKNQARCRQPPARSERSGNKHERRDRAARSAATSLLILQRDGDSFQANNDCLNAAGDDDETGPIQDREPSERSITEEFEPRAEAERDHAPRLRHNSAELALDSKRLSKQADVGCDHREDRRPLSDEWINQ